MHLNVVLESGSLGIAFLTRQGARKPSANFGISDAAAMQDTARLWAVAATGMITGLTLYQSINAVEARLRV